MFSTRGSRIAGALVASVFAVFNLGVVAFLRVNTADLLGVAVCSLLLVKGALFGAVAFNFFSDREPESVLTFLTPRQWRAGGAGFAAVSCLFVLAGVQGNWGAAVAAIVYVGFSFGCFRVSQSISAEASA